MVPSDDVDDRDVGPLASETLCEVCTYMQCGEEGDAPACTACLVDGHHGIYVPQAFARQYLMNAGDWGVSAEDRATLLAGPEAPDYWETWGDVLDRAEYRKEIARRYSPIVEHWQLEQDGDLFARLVSVDPYEIERNEG
jgi:hypothetical protein